MKEKIKQYTRPGFAMLLSLFLIIGGCVCVQVGAAKDEPVVLRVAFPQVKGLTETAEDGTRYGLVVDYLNEIAKYTGWEYEYIDTTGETMLDEFAEGKYDLMGGNYYMPGWEEYFAYPDYNTGYSKSVLLATRDDTSIKSYSLESLNGKTIGVYERAIENIRRLKEFLSINNLDCEIRTISYEEHAQDSNLYRYIDNGEVDLLLGNSNEGGDTYRIVTSYDSQPYYIVTTVGNTEVLDGLNMALEMIMDSDPRFGTQHYEANFLDRRFNDIQLNQEELNYIKQKENIRVAVLNNWHPLFCLNMDTELHAGVIPDILEEVTKFSDLKFSYVYAETYMDAIRMVQQKEADILGFFMGSEEEAKRNDLVRSSSYVSLDSIIVRNKKSSYPDDGLMGAMVEGRELPSDISSKHVLVYPKTKDALIAVNRGEADFTYGLSAQLEREIQKGHFANLVPVTLVNNQNEICFALPKPAEVNLLTILNKSINVLSEAEKTKILNRNMVSIGVDQFSLVEFIYANPFTFMVIVTIFLVIIVVIILWISRSHINALVMKNNLEKAEANSRAKGEFLSRMSHEIRTPMNAVVGLTDLTSMMSGLPKEVQENLTKIRVSSQYMLELINDILDMSRIENGMLSITKEPFSLKKVLDEIQIMMEPEAKRRQITYILEDAIFHKDVIGDAIRLRQVLINLITNALKFTAAQGSVILHVEEIASHAKDATFMFRVLDNGSGILPEDQHRIFESFEQVGTNTSKCQGTGLGLTISRSIVSLMGGELQLKSELDCGSEFYFTISLPLCEAVEDEPEYSVKEGALKDVHILLAEDNDLNAEIAIQLLEIQGAKVSWCKNGKIAVEQFAKSQMGEYQIIIMDIQMPEMNGLDATRAIRQLSHPDANVIPIVAMTANSFKEDVEVALEAGMDKFISKPLDVNYLYHVLLELL